MVSGHHQQKIFHAQWDSLHLGRYIALAQHHKVKPGRIRVVRNMELGAQLVAEGLGVGFIRQGYQKNIHYPKPVKYYTIDSSKYGQNVVVAYRQDVELTKPMRAMIMQMKDAAEEYLEF